MKCIKPSGPYLAFLAIVLIISFVGIPEGNANIQEDFNQITAEKYEQGNMTAGENITMLNIDRHE